MARVTIRSRCERGLQANQHQPEPSNDDAQRRACASREGCSETEGGQWIPKSAFGGGRRQPCYDGVKCPMGGRPFGRLWGCGKSARARTCRLARRTWPQLGRASVSAACPARHKSRHAPVPAVPARKIVARGRSQQDRSCWTSGARNAHNYGHTGGELATLHSSLHPQPCARRVHRCHQPKQLVAEVLAGERST